MSKRKRTTPAASFQAGNRVRVRHGVMDTDYPDMPLGGWTGTIAEAHDDSMFTVRWSEETLASIHPIFKKRCDKDGLEFDQYWIGGEDLEPDPGGPLRIEHPKQITTRPLSRRDQDDRIRMVFGLTSNDPLPDVDDETLKAYREHLSTNLVFPFTAEHRAEYGHAKGVKVTSLRDSDDDPMIDEMYGILCEAQTEVQILTLPLSELEDAQGKPNRQLIQDYCYWFWNWQ